MGGDHGERGEGHVSPPTIGSDANVNSKHPHPNMTKFATTFSLLFQSEGMLFRLIILGGYSTFLKRFHVHISHWGFRN